MDFLWTVSKYSNFFGPLAFVTVYVCNFCKQEFFLQLSCRICIVCRLVMPLQYCLWCAAILWCCILSRPMVTKMLTTDYFARIWSPKSCSFIAGWNLVTWFCFNSVYACFRCIWRDFAYTNDGHQPHLAWCALYIRIKKLCLLACYWKTF